MTNLEERVKQMPPYVPVVSVNHSQNVRLGRGPGNAVPGVLAGEQSSRTPCAFYADLGRSEVRRDFQRHSAVGAIVEVGAPSSGVFSDWFLKSATGLVPAAGTGFTLSVTPQTTSLLAPVIQSRTFGTMLSVTQPDGTALGAGTNLAQLTIAKPDATYDRWDLLYVDQAGRLQLRTGPIGSTIVNNVFTITPVGTPAAGNFKLSFTWHGNWYTTANIAYNASGATIATAMIAATRALNYPAGVTASAAAAPAIPALGFTGSGADVSAGAATITSANFVSGPISNQIISDYPSGTASTGYTFATTTTGSGGADPQPLGGTMLPLAHIYVPHAAANAAACVPFQVLPLQSL